MSSKTTTKPGGPPRIPVKIHPTGQTIEVAPGTAYADLPPTHVPRAGIVRWTPAGDGTYRPRVQVLEIWVRVSHAGDYGITIPRDTLVRLGNAGFIELAQPSPGHTAVNLDSLLAHIEKCKDPEFWNKERRQRYREALWSWSDGDGGAGAGETLKR
jgi:hypothetical protein